MIKSENCLSSVDKIPHYNYKKYCRILCSGGLPQVGIIGLSVNFLEICAIILTIFVKITILTMERKYDKSSCCEKIRKR